MYTICMVGTGYVGLVTGACLADFGNRVICVDVDAKRIEMLRAGKIPFFEPLLDDLVLRNQKADRLDFTTELAPAVRQADVVFIAVGTPDRGDGHADLSALFKVVEDIAPNVNGYKLVVTKSTVPVGTGRKVQRKLAALLGSEARFDVCSNPEFLREGSARAGRCSASWRRSSGRKPGSMWLRTPSSCARVRPSRTSCVRTASWWAPNPNAPAR